jgi:hypothetical protein
MTSSVIDANARLENLRRDKVEAQARIGDVLAWLVDAHRADTLLSRSEITQALSRAIGYCEDRIAEATDRIERELEREIEAEIGALERRGLW